MMILALMVAEADDSLILAIQNTRLQPSTPLRAMMATVLLLMIDLI